MKPFKHARGSVQRWGGQPSDYMPIHDFLDSSKQCMPDMRHRAMYHHALGCFLVERIFGHTLINSDGREVSTRDVAESHIIEDLGFLPSLEDYFDELPLSKWHGGIHRLPKDERPPTPAEVRQVTRDRVCSAVYQGIRDGSLLSTFDDLGSDEQNQAYDKTIDNIIAAVRGTTEHQEED